MSASIDITFESLAIYFFKIAWFVPRLSQNNDEFQISFWIVSSKVLSYMQVLWRTKSIKLLRNMSDKILVLEGVSI